MTSNSAVTSSPASVIRRRVGGSQGVVWPNRVASGRAVPGPRLHRHQPWTSGRTSRHLLQPVYRSWALCLASDGRGRGLATDVRRHPVTDLRLRAPSARNGLVRAQILRATRGEVSLAGKASPVQHSGAANRPRSEVRFWPRDWQRSGEHGVNRTLNANEFV